MECRPQAPEAAAPLGLIAWCLQLDPALLRCDSPLLWLGVSALQDTYTCSSCVSACGCTHCTHCSWDCNCATPCTVQCTEVFAAMPSQSHPGRASCSVPKHLLSIKHCHAARMSATFQPPCLVPHGTTCQQLVFGQQHLATASTGITAETTLSIHPHCHTCRIKIASESPYAAAS